MFTYIFSEYFQLLSWLKRGFQKKFTIFPSSFPPQLSMHLLLSSNEKYVCSQKTVVSPDILHITNLKGFIYGLGYP